MAFRESSRMEERVALLREHDSGVYSVGELCSRYGISRETFYVWKRRRDLGQPDWFLDRSHAPLRCPHAMSAEVTEAILDLRGRFVHFGPKKLRARMQRTEPERACPSASSIGALLKRKGLVQAKPRRAHAKELAPVVTVAEHPCDEWAMDFKGWFRTQDGTRCDPFTVTDTVSRYLVGLEIIPVRQESVQQALTRMFYDFGLPLAVRSDNGAPFGSHGAGGLSRLSVWLLLLGVEPNFVPPGSPQHNGRHERLHRTLKAETAAPTAADALSQQVCFDTFRQRYNEQRPHESLAMDEPAAHWKPSVRGLPVRLKEPSYDAHHEVRRVNPDGTIAWQGERVFIGEALKGQWIGLEETERGAYCVRFMHRDLGALSAEGRFQRFAPPRARFERQAPTGGG